MGCLVYLRSRRSHLFFQSPSYSRGIDGMVGNYFYVAPYGAGRSEKKIDRKYRSEFS
jgi:predicted dithiol-disulfide oxidoreductase (DUF899 family)